jgi:two-component system, NtrC family, sensor histidine kinase PilS
MSANTPEIIYPCPLSKGYGIPVRQAWLLLNVFLCYRLVLACLFIFLYFSAWGSSLIRIENSHLYQFSSYSYLALTVTSATCIIWRCSGYGFQAQLLILSDILILTLLMHACGGVNSGIGTLLAVSIASGGLLIGGRCAVFFAALASLSVLIEQIFAHYTGSFQPGSYSYAGMLGISFFAIALLSFILAKRSEETLELADQQKNTIIKLEELNKYIIQHLQSGIIITNKSQQVKMANEASLRLLNLSILPVKLDDISEHLSQSFEAWLVDPDQYLIDLWLPDNSEIHCRFMVLPISREFFMIILEDIALYNQRLQQSKLASLGRLTASIAHEIRNPLGAISHAGQLLSENSRFSIEDLRLTEIIQNNAKRVNQIIDDILQISKRNNSVREKIHINQWLIQYLNNFLLEQDVAAEKFKIVPSENPLCAFMDPGHLKQIMNNLCQNALDYGKPEAGVIILRTSTIQQAPCIEVIDNGAGIDQEFIDHLFEPFFTTSSSGTGLGLYISRELAELNQAKIHYYLNEDNKNCFRLTLQDANHTLIEI